MLFLIFDMALKYRAFPASLLAFFLFRGPKKLLVNFGISNLLIGMLFPWHLFFR